MLGYESIPKKKTIKKQQIFTYIVQVSQQEILSCHNYIVQQKSIFCCCEKKIVKNTKKSRMRETLTLSGCVDSSTNTMKSRLFDTFLHFWALFRQLFAFFGTFCDFPGTFCTKKIMCHMSQVTSYMSHVTCDMSPSTCH